MWTELLQDFQTILILQRLGSSIEGTVLMKPSVILVAMSVHDTGISIFSADLIESKPIK
jgi:hypothetical protein